MGGRRLEWVDGGWSGWAEVGVGGRRLEWVDGG